ncbi:MAG: aldo/keto reductase [Actinobacteria bacterium]|nr:aldo/keto reductase [Actinomycetota bacterium]
MKFIKLGGADIEVSVVAFGAWAIGGLWWGGTDEKNSIEAIKASLENGINFIDTAPAYGKGLSEEYVAKAIKGRRDSVVIATKCGLRWDLNKGLYFFDYPSGEQVYRFLGKESIEYELDLSLKRLKTDYIDLYQIHWQDPTTPISETMEMLLRLKDKGKIRAIGVSNASFEQIKEYLKYGVLNTDQEKYSILSRQVEKEIQPFCLKNNITMLAYSPMGRGLLTGRISTDRIFKEGDSRLSDEIFSKDNISFINKLLEKHIKPIAEKYNATYGNIAVAWVVNKPNWVALVGARNREQAYENARAGDIMLDDEDIKNINEFINEYESRK